MGKYKKFFLWIKKNFFRKVQEIFSLGEKLVFKASIRNYFTEILKKAYKTTGHLKQFHNFLPRPALVTKDKAYIRPYLTFEDIAVQCFPGLL